MGRMITKRKSNIMNFFISEGLSVIVATLIIMGGLLVLTRQAKWFRSDIMLLGFCVLCYLLDTIWWWFEIRIPFTEISFCFHGKPYILTVFFAASAISFTVLIIRRWRRIKRNDKD